MCTLLCLRKSCRLPRTLNGSSLHHRYTKKVGSFTPQVALEYLAESKQRQFLHFPSSSPSFSGLYYYFLLGVLLPGLLFCFLDEGDRRRKLSTSVWRIWFIWSSFSRWFLYFSIVSAKRVKIKKRICDEIVSPRTEECRRRVSIVLLRFVCERVGGAPLLLRQGQESRYP
jgi:hypothetical protein